MANESLFKLTINPTFRDFRGRFAEADKQLLDDRRESVRVLGRYFVKLAKEEAPISTGEFRKSIRWRSFIKGTSELGFTVSHADPLGKWIMFGTKPHPIPLNGVPKGYPLRFFWPKMGKVWFSMTVEHPGTKPDNYIGRAQKSWNKKADTEINRISTRYVTRIANG